MSRRCGNWLHTLAKYVEETESPRHFWSWAGIFVLSSVLERRVWLPYGLHTIYPNIYLLMVAPPGRCRKSAPVSFAKKILQEVECNVFVDSPTKRALTKYMAELARVCAFRFIRSDGVELSKPQCPIALVSKELSSFFAINLKEMVEVLTDLFDSHDEWEYQTSEKGKDKLYGICVGCYFATTPNWIARNLPEEAIGGGFTSRFVSIYGNEKYKFVPIPPEPDAILYRAMVEDLAMLKRLSGEFKWGTGSKELFAGWYSTIEQKVQGTFDERIRVFLEREHIIALKVAMALHMSYADDLVITVTDLQAAMALVEEVEAGIPFAFGSHGSAINAHAIDRVSEQLSIVKKMSFQELLRINYKNTTRPEMREIVDTLKEMGLVESALAEKKGRMVETVIWKGKHGVLLGEN